MRKEIQPQTSIGCTAEILARVIKFKSEYNAHEGQDLNNYQTTDLVIKAGIKSLEESCGLSPDKTNACEGD